MNRLTCELSLVLIVAVYVNYRTPAPDVDAAHCAPIQPWSHVNLAPVETRAFHGLIGATARRGILGEISVRDRARCWVLLRIVVDVFRYAPERCDSLERVLRAYAVERPAPEKKPTRSPGPPCH